MGGMNVSAAHRDGLMHKDRLSLALHEAISEKLKNAPEAIVERARKNAIRFEKSRPRHMRATYQRWQRWLRLPVDDLAERILDVSEAAIWMRHHTPFAGSLSQRERADVIHRCRNGGLE